MKENDVSLEDSLSRGRSLNVVSELAKYTRTINIRICFSRRQSVLRADVSSRVERSSVNYRFAPGISDSAVFVSRESPFNDFLKKKKKKKRKKEEQKEETSYEKVVFRSSRYHSVRNHSRLYMLHGQDPVYVLINIEIYIVPMSEYAGLSILWLSVDRLNTFSL